MTTSHSRRIADINYAAKRQRENDRRDRFIAAALTGLCSQSFESDDYTWMADQAIAIADRVIKRDAE